MATDDSKTNKNEVSTDLDANSQTPDQGRRKVTKAGLAAPVMMSLASTPVWGANCSESGQMSGNLSNPNDMCGGEGCTPGYWGRLQHLDSWHPDYQPGDAFVDVFGIDAFPGATLLQVVNGNAPSQNTPSPATCAPAAACENLLRQLGFHAVAGLQNAATSVAYDLSVQNVIDIFVNAYNGGTKAHLEGAKSFLDSLNNQGCPLN